MKNFHIFAKKSLMKSKISSQKSKTRKIDKIENQNFSEISIFCKNFIDFFENFAIFFFWFFDFSAKMLIFWCDRSRSWVKGFWIGLKIWKAEDLLFRLSTTLLGANHSLKSLYTIEVRDGYPYFGGSNLLFSEIGRPTYGKLYCSWSFFHIFQLFRRFSIFSSWFSFFFKKSKKS